VPWPVLEALAHGVRSCREGARQPLQPASIASIPGAANDERQLTC
jgi:hypothetical protein